MIATKNAKSTFPYLSEELDKSQSPVAESVDAPRLSMNRTIPIGSHHIHCEPPSQRPQSDSGKLIFIVIQYIIFVCFVPPIGLELINLCSTCFCGELY